MNGRVRASGHGLPRRASCFGRVALLAFLGTLPYVARADSPACQDRNLIEYSYGGFAAGDVILGPMLLPPLLKIYDDGRVVFHREGRFWTGSYADRDLDQLKGYLRKSPLLNEIGIENVKHGSSPGYHGGMTYIRYCGEGEEIIKGALRLPSRGRWARLIQRLWKTLPATSVAFVPERIELRVWESSAKEAIPWPFHERLDLSTLVDQRVDVADREISRFLFDGFEGGFSWLQVDVKQGTQSYRLVLETVPGWYEDTNLRLMLGFMADSYLSDAAGKD